MPPTTRKTSNKYAPSVWGKEVLIDLTVPSGQTCQVRRVGPVALIKAGLLDQLDILSSLVQTEHVDRVEKGVTPPNREQQTLQIKELLADKDKLFAAINLMDQITMYVVLQPKLVKLDNEGVREPGLVYIDDVDLLDKVFIFQFVVGGSADLERFRKEFSETMGDVADLQNIQL